MDILKEELLEKRQSISEETGGRNLFKRSEIEQKRIQKRRADAEAKRICQNQKPNFKLDSKKSKPESGADSSSKVPISLFGESDDDLLDRLTYVLQAGLFELDDIVELKRRVKYGAGGEDGDGHKNMKNNFCELCDEDKILSFFLKLLTEWNQELDEMTEMEKMTAKGKSTLAAFKQSAKNLNPLFNFCRKKVLRHDIRQSLTLLANCCMKRDYPAAFNQYCQIAIRKSSWSTGIHEHVAHVMNDETTRKYLMSVKRLMMFCQSRHPGVY